MALEITSTKSMSKEELARLVDHTNLRSTSTKADIVQLCREAREYGFKSVCIHPCHVPLAKKELQDSQVLVCTVVGFPLGAQKSEMKAFEARHAVKDGADEIDMVLNVGTLKDGVYAFVGQEIRAVVEASVPARVKVILETCYLSDEEIVRACEVCVSAGAKFVKTSTGFGPAGASVEHVRLMRGTVGEDVGVKAAGGIRSLEDALRMIDAGATRLGCSASVKIIRELNEEEG